MKNRIVTFKSFLFKSVIIGFLITSCSQNDDSELNYSLDIHPPQWLQGNWIEDDWEQSESKTEFIFKENNILYLLNESVFIDYQKKYGNSEAPVSYSVDEISNTDENYELTVRETRAHGGTFMYTREIWTKVNENKIRYIITAADCPECIHDTIYYSKMED